MRAPARALGARCVRPRGRYHERSVVIPSVTELAFPLNLSYLFRLLSRHRPVVLFFAALSLAGIAAVVVLKPPAYQATAAVVLLNPPAVPQATIANPSVPARYQNPYVQFGDLSVVVDILVRVTGSDEIKNALKANGLQGTFTIAANRDFYRGPIVDVAAEAKTSAAAIKDTKLLIKEINDQLLTLQSNQGTDPAYFIRAGTVVGADRATRVFSGTLRLLVAAVGAGAVMTLGSGLMADFLSRRRSDGPDRKAAKIADPPESLVEPTRVESPPESGGPRRASKPTPVPRRKAN